MRRVLAIAALSVRAAVRSRVLLVLAGLLGVCIVGIPLTVKGDGTVGGHVQILLRYTLGFAMAILSVSTVWAGCGAIATEVQDRQIHLVVTKPVGRGEIWLGKWIGLLALNLVLLGGSGGVVYALLRHTTRPAALSPEDRQALAEEILVARAELRPAAPDVEAEARREVQARAAAGEMPPGVPPAQVLEAVRRGLRVQAFAVAPGGRRTWEVALPFAPDRARPAFLQFRLSKSQIGLEPVRGRWVFGAADAAVRLEAEGAFTPEAVHTVRIPPEALDGRTLALTYENLDEGAATVLFSPDDGIQALLHRGGFGANLVRALAILYCRLAFLAAIGLSAGALLSLPVAAFASVSLVLLTGLGGYLRGLAAQGAYFGGAQPSLAAAAANRALGLGFRALNAVVAPLRGPDPLDLLARGRLVDGGAVGEAALVQVVLYAGVLGLLCGFAFRRRELGLPS